MKNSTVFVFRRRIIQRECLKKSAVLKQKGASKNGAGCRVIGGETCCRESPARGGIDFRGIEWFGPKFAILGSGELLNFPGSLVQLIAAKIDQLDTFFIDGDGFIKRELARFQRPGNFFQPMEGIFKRLFFLHELSPII